MPVRSRLRSIDDYPARIRPWRYLITKEITVDGWIRCPNRWLTLRKTSETAAVPGALTLAVEGENRPHTGKSPVSDPFLSSSCPVLKQQAGAIATNSCSSFETSMGWMTKLSIPLVRT